MDCERGGNGERLLAEREPDLSLQQLLERAHVALGSPSRAAPSRERQLEQRVAALEGRLTKKDAVIAENALLIYREPQRADPYAITPSHRDSIALGDHDDVDSEEYVKIKKEFREP